MWSKIILFIISISFVYSALAQQYEGFAELMEINEQTAIFKVESYADKKDDVIEVAKKTLIYKLLYEGVEDFYDGKMLKETDRSQYYLDNFFKGGNKAPYNAFIDGAQLEGDVENLPSGSYKGTVNVVLKYSFLFSTLRTNKIMIDPNEKEVENQPAQKKKTFKINR